MGDLFNLRGKKKLYSAAEVISWLDTALEGDAGFIDEDASNISTELLYMLTEAFKKIYPDGILLGEAKLHIHTFYILALRYLLNSAFATELQKLIHIIREDIDVHAMLDSSPLDDTRAEVITEHLIQTKYANNKHLNNDIRGYSYAMYIVNNAYRGFPIYSTKGIEAVLDFFAAINDKPDMALWSIRERQVIVSPQVSFLSLIGVMIKIEELLDNLEALRPRFDKALKLYLERFK